MRILHIIDPTTPEDALFTLAVICRRVAADHQVLALGHQSVMRAAVAAGVAGSTIHVARAAGWWDPSGWRSVHRKFHADQPDLLHCWGYWAITAAAMPRHLPAVRIASLHTQPTPGEIRLLRMAGRRAPWFVLCSAREIFDQMRYAGLPRDRLAHVPPGAAEIAGPAADPAQSRKMLGLPADDHPVVFLGGAPHVHNRQDEGLWAVGILEQIYPQARALIQLGQVHHAPTQAQVRRLVEFSQSLLHPDMIHFIEPEIPLQTVLAAADIMLFTPDQEIDSAMMLQAMAMGVPVVATSVPGLVDMVGNSQSVMLAPVHEPWQLAAAAHQLLSKPEQAREQTLAARRHVEIACSSGHLAERFFSIYRQLCVAPQQPLAILA